MNDMTVIIICFIILIAGGPIAELVYILFIKKKDDL
jgi:hypothetical protein